MLQEMDNSSCFITEPIIADQLILLSEHRQSRNPRSSGF